MYKIGFSLSYKVWCHGAERYGVGVGDGNRGKRGVVPNQSDGTFVSISIKFWSKLFLLWKVLFYRVYATQTGEYCM
jgi:hypothetical protein